MHLLIGKEYTLDNLKNIKLVTKDIKDHKLYWVKIIDEQKKLIDCFLFCYDKSIVDKIKEVYKVNNYTYKFELKGLVK
jgi:hypothetical protein